jgi:GNAT superfamily N-acetyltransferase
MELLDIEKSSEGTFFRCLHDEKPAEPLMMDMRDNWYRRFKDKGLRAKLLIDDDEQFVGLCQYIPIEHSHLVGEKLMAILCMWVHGYEHLVGNQQGKGYGRFMLEQIEEDSRSAGMSGIAAWGMDFPYWNPVSFYEHMGYSRADEDQPVVLVWKAFEPDAEAPRLLKPKIELSAGTDKVNLVAFRNCWCSGCGYVLNCREAIRGLDDIVDYSEIDTSEGKIRDYYGIDNGTFLDGKPYRPYEPPWPASELRAEILKLYKAKKKR